MVSPRVSLPSLGIVTALATAAPAQDVVINEVMSSNGGAVRDEDGEASDWVEIVNRGAAPVALAGYGLSDDDQALRWRFPAVVLEPGARKLVFCSGKDRADAPAHWETVITGGDSWRHLVPTAEPPAAWRSPGFNDAAWASGPSGIGYGDGDDRTQVAAGTLAVYARKTFQVADPEAVSHVYLDIDFDDGFVAYLNGTEIARENLAGQGAPPPFNAVAVTSTEPRLTTGGELFHLRDPGTRSLLRAGENVLAIQVHNASAASSDLSLLPFLTLGMSQAPANARGPAEILKSTLQALHTSFKLSGTGESIRLSSPAGALLDFADASSLPVDVSRGRYPDATGPFVIHSPATPGEVNASPGFAAVGSAVSFSHVGGIHPRAFSLALSQDDLVGAIHFTTDGSPPTNASTRYAGPIQINATTVVRAAVLGAGIYPGPPATHTFVVGRGITLPVVSISTDPANFFSNDSGIYVTGDTYDASFPHFGANFWEDWERPVHLELFERDGSLAFSAGAGAKIFGGWSRGHPQRSLAFFARGRYGAGKFDYPIFAPDKGIKSFESFILRNSGNDWQITHFRDALMTTLVKDLGIDRLAYRPSIVFINGEYWGILNLREKVNEHFLAANHRGVRPDQIDLLEAGGTPIHGDADHYNAMLGVLQAGQVVDAAAYARIEAMVDIENFIDYQAAQIFYDNTDWPGNNIKFWRPRVEGGRWRWILYDTDFGFGIWNPNNYANNTLAFALEPNGPAWPNPPWSTLMLRRLVTNGTFVEEFANRFATHLNTIFTPAKVVALVDAMARGIEAEMPAQRSRWGSDINSWRSSVQALKDFANRRVPQMRNHLRSTFGLGATAQLRISVAPPAGGVVAIHGIPIRSFPFNGAYFQGLPVRLEARPDPGYRFVGWTGIDPAQSPQASVTLGAGTLSLTAAFELDCSSLRDVVINEIQYNPDAAADSGDWVEIHNRTAREIDVSGWTLRDAAEAHSFALPPGTRLPAGGHLVLCASLDSFAGQHPGVSNFAGDIGFSFAGQGESIGLFDAGGTEVDRVAYDDAPPWPTEPDGKGATLALRSPLRHGSHAPYWAASPSGGTPGERNDVFEEVETSCGAGETLLVRGDCDADGAVSIADPVRLLFVNFTGAPAPCLAACDANGDGSTGGVTDALHLLGYLFRQGPAPAAPFPACGAPALPSDTALGCASPPAACP